VLKLIMQHLPSCRRRLNNLHFHQYMRSVDDLFKKISRIERERERERVRSKLWCHHTCEAKATLALRKCRLLSHSLSQSRWYDRVSNILCFYFSHSIPLSLHSCLFSEDKTWSSAIFVYILYSSPATHDWSPQHPQYSYRWVSLCLSVCVLLYYTLLSSKESLLIQYIEIYCFAFYLSLTHSFTNLFSFLFKNFSFYYYWVYVYMKKSENKLS
jgi:hypothetical protein